MRLRDGKFRMMAAMLTLLSARTLAQPFDPLPAVDLSRFTPADFTDDELDIPAGGNNANHAMPYLLAHFKTIADAVSDGSGKWPRGFIALVVWRGEQDNRPHNMRVMENNLSLAYFYVTDRPWNVYRGHPALRQRLEAVFEFMIKEQGPTGAFSEYEPQKWRLAPTAFLTKFLGQTITLLKRPGAPPIDPKLLERVIAMQRKAILVVLEDPGFYEHGRHFTNQFGNVWAGGLAYLALFSTDVEVRQKLEMRHASSHKDFFSPAGFPYENDGPDWSYNLGTHTSNQRMARYYTRRASLMGKQFVREEQSFHEWLSYNAVPVPGGIGFVLNRAVETRGREGYLSQMESNFADEVELVRAFAPTDVEVAARRATARKLAEQTWPKVEKLAVGEFRAYSPYDFLHREHSPTHPTVAQRDAARAKLLPYIARKKFNHQRVDDRREPPPTYTFVQRPSYYAVFNSGSQKSDQRLGLGLLWNSELGALLQSQTGSEAHAWGTCDAEGGALHEAGSIAARFQSGDQPIPSRPGPRDLPDAQLAVTYELGPNGTKEVRFLDDRIAVFVTYGGAFREQIPLLLLPDDQLRINGSITLRRGSGALLIDTDDVVQVTTTRGGSRVGPYHVASVHLHGKGKLAYTIRVAKNR